MRSTDKWHSGSIYAADARESHLEPFIF